ncbi:MAG: tetratricopeptide repeat protein [Desulfobacterales bacterium]|nr:tetratricopeptide repeat protein [Desulfobacterales bacterium]
MAVIVACQGMGPLKAEYKFARSQYGEAIPLFEAYLKGNPGDYSARGRLGIAYLKAGKNEKAAETLERVIRDNPGDADATLYLGVSYVNMKAFGKALTVWEQYSDPNRPLVEAEIRRQVTLLKIAESQRIAKASLARETQVGTAPVDQDTIAVCYFQDLSPDKTLRAFQKGLAAMVISDLAKIKSVKVVERLQLQALLGEMKLGQTGIVDLATAPRVGRLLGASTLVVGDLKLGSVQVSASLASTVAQQVQGTTTVTVEMENFFDISPAIVSDVAHMLGIELSASQMAAIGTVHTKNFKAFSYFGQALDALDGGNWAAAQAFFDKAVREDPKFGLAKAGGESCPGGGSPDVGAVSAAQVASAVQDSVESAMTEQEASAAEANTETGGGGGDGGGGGSH